MRIHYSSTLESIKNCSFHCLRLKFNLTDITIFEYYFLVKELIFYPSLIEM